MIKLDIKANRFLKTYSQSPSIEELFCMLDFKF